MISIINIRVLLVCLIFCCAFQAMAENGRSVSFAFYSTQLEVKYHSDILSPTFTTISEREMVRYFNDLKETPYQSLLEDLLQKKEQLKLNDWLFYELMHKSVEIIYARKQRIQRTLVRWFLLTEAGFDTRLTYLEDQVFIYVHSTDEIYDVPMIEDKGRTFVNISSIHRGIKSQPALYLLNYSPNPEGKAFQFYLKSLPDLPPQVQQQNLSFVYEQDTIRLDLEVDNTISELMEGYPFISEREYLEVPLSNTLANSLIPQMKRLVAGKTPEEAVRTLVAFTRSCFQYKEDKEYFGKAKPMIADEVFHYPYSDCEDRSALFYVLIKELLDLPMIIVAFPDHLTIGIALPDFVGNSIQYEGRDYFICDPTGPANSTEIGTFPYGYEDKAFKIIGQYK